MRNLPIRRSDAPEAPTDARGRLSIIEPTHSAALSRRRGLSGASRAWRRAGRAALHEVLEGREGARARASGLERHRRLEQAPGKPAPHRHLRVTREQGPIALRMNRPCVLGTSKERDSRALVGERPTVVPRGELLMDRHPTHESAGPLGADALGLLPLARRVHDGLRPEGDVLQSYEVRPGFHGLRFDAYRGGQSDHPHGATSDDASAATTAARPRIVRRRPCILGS